MAGVGGVLTKFAEQVPGGVLGFFENQNTSELGRLVQKEAISPEMYMRGTVIQQVGDIAKGIVGNQKEAIQARERIQTLGMKLAYFAIDRLSNIQDKALELAKENQKIIREIVGENSEVGKTIASCYEKHLAALGQAFATPDPALRTLMVDTYIKAYDSTKASLDAISKGNVEIVKAGTLDPAFFDACAKQTGAIISQVNQLAIELAKEEEGSFKVIASEVGQTVRCMITEGRGLTQSFIPWAKSAPAPAVAGPSTPGDAPAIKGPETPAGTPSTQPTAPGTPATPAGTPATQPAAPGTPATAGGTPSAEPATSQSQATTSQSEGDGGSPATSSSGSSRLHDI